MRREISMERELQALMEENQQLKKDNEKMLHIIDQMKNTLNRLIDRYMTYSEHSSQEQS